MENAFFSWMTATIPYDWAALLIRLAIGCALLPYGLKKFSERKTEKNFPAVLGLSSRLSFTLAMLAETLVPICVILGFCTRLAVLPAIFSMSVATKVSKGPFFSSPALAFVLGFIAIFFIGAGKISLDYLLM